MIKLKRTLAGYVGAAAALSAGMPASLAYAQEHVEEVLVSGIRGSLKRAADQKQFSDGVVDVISAEDLGKFPDSNVAESLQRVTGVAITRARGGEGQFVTIRGLGEEFNTVTYNGRVIATENAGREFSFDVIASELISNAEVFKSSQANQVSGGIGGLINVTSAKPFDNPGLQMSGSIGGQHDDLSDEIGTRLSGVVSNTYDTFGFLASFSYQDREVRNDIAENIGTFTYDVDQNGSIYDPADPNSQLAHSGARIAANSLLTNEEDRKRLGGTLALQFRPNELLDITVDALYTSYESPSQAYGVSYFPFDASFFEPGSIKVTDDGIISQANLRSAPGSVVNQEGSSPFLTSDFLARSTQTDTETFLLGANFDYSLSDDVVLTGDIAFSRADGARDNTASGAGSGSFFVAGVPFAEVSLNSVAGIVPDFDILIPDALNPSNPQIANPDANLVGINQVNPEVLRAHFARVDTFEITDDVLSMNFDVDWHLDDNATLKAGAYFISREKDIQAVNNVPTQCTFCGYANQLQALNPVVFNAALGGGAFVPNIGLNDFLSESGANIPRVFPAIPTRVFLQSYQNVGRGSDNLVQAQEGFNALTNGVAFRPTESSVIEEDVFSVYVQANLEGDFSSIPWRANAGLRLEQTDLTSSGAANLLDSVRPAGGADQVFGFTDATSVSFDNSYFDVLPSFNIAFDLTDQLILRGAFATTITRPTLTDLSAGSVVTSINVGLEGISAGNPKLEATRSNNIDLSLEYYGDNWTSSAALFHKDINDFVSNATVRQDITIPKSFAVGDPNQLTDLGAKTVNFLVSRPENGDNATVDGLELATQYLFDNGFGLGGNVTLVDSSASVAGVSTSLENVSDLSYNVFAFYETERFSSRIAVNFRDEYLQTTLGQDGLSETVDDFTSIDATFSYAVTDNFTVFTEGINLGNEDFYVYSAGSKNLIRSFDEFGRRINFGVRGFF